MWKEEYCVGVELIDEQHKALFQMVQKLIQTVNENKGWEQRKEECQQSITFLKKYVIEHFAAEEAYQKEIGYDGFSGHQLLHKNFTAEVAVYEQRLVQTSFDVDIVKQFVGMLTAWLIYHVADTDQKITGKQAVEKPTVKKSIVQSFLKSVSDVLHTMVQMDASQVKGHMLQEGDRLGELGVTLDIIGDIKGKVLFGYSKQFALEMMKKMTFMEMHEIDGMVCSAMAEISNIISGSAATIIRSGDIACDITPPKVISVTALEESGIFGNGILVETPIGEMLVATKMES